MDGPRNIFIDEFGDKKPAAKKQGKPIADVAVEETGSGNIFAETFGVKKKEEATISYPIVTPKSETTSSGAKLGASAEKDEPQEDPDTEIDIFGTGPLKTQGAVGVALGGVLKALTPKSPITSIEDFNTSFEEKTGKKEFELGSDLPQISKAREEKKYLKYSELDESLGNSTQSIFSGEGTMNDFINVKNNAPKIFDSIKANLNIATSKEDIKPGENQEDSYVFDVYNQYKDKVVNDRLEIGRGRRENIAAEIEKTLPSATEFTGQKYEAPQNLQEAKKIVDDIAAKKADLQFIMKNSSSGVGLADKVSQVENFSKEIAAGELALPALTQAISGFVFDEESKKNPNVSTFDVGKRIYELINPKGYALYKEAGGDQLYRAGGFGQGFSETPKKADAINRQIMELGINAFNTFGNKTAIQVADNDSKSLDWKYTKPIEEETKHMIAAKLLASGIKPNKATDEQKDEIAETLPDINRDVWFEKNKLENNVSLPSTGLGYSTKGSYYNTVEDASKTLLGWMMPGRGRERALDVLEQQSTSDIVGENPESKARLDQLRKKEKDGKELTGEEIKEKENLEQFTDVRSGWQKFKDLSGSGVGQFAGFGTISAFTGGLGNARTAWGVLKSLVSPMADREGMLIGGYLMSREANARDAVAMFPGEKDGLKRFVYGETASLIDTYIERLFQEEKFLSGLTKQKVADLIPKLTAQNIRKELNEGLVKKIAKGTVAVIAEQQKTPLQEGLEESIAAKLKDVFHGILDPEREAMTFDEILNVGTQAYLSTQLLGVPKGVMATRNKTVPINAIWDAASDKETAFATKFKILEMQANGDLTPDQANERISLLNTAQKFYQDNPVLSGNMGALSLPKRQNYLARLMNEAVLQKKADETIDDNAKATYNKEIAESKKARKAIFEGDVEVTDRNDERPTPRETKAANDTWKATIQAIGERTDIDEQEKEGLKQAEDERHAAEIAQLGKDEATLKKIQSGERVSPDEKKENIQYFIDKVGEAPVAAAQRFGEDAVKELLPRVSTEKLAANYYTLAKFDSNSPDALALEEELTKREAAAEMPSVDALKDVESTIKALKPINDERWDRITKSSKEYLGNEGDAAVAYHKAKKDGSNPELVKAVEQALTPEQAKPVSLEQKPKVDEAAPEGTEKLGVPVDKSALGSVEGTAKALGGVGENLNFEKNKQDGTDKNTQKLQTDREEGRKESEKDVSISPEISEKVDKLTDDEIKSAIDDIGYSITGRNLFYKKAQEIYHREVMTWEQLDTLPLSEKPKAQKEFEKWTEKNKRKILKESLSDQSLLGKEQTQSQKPKVDEVAPEGTIPASKNIEQEKAEIEKWLQDSDEHSDFISFDWDGNNLEIFKSRDEAVIELSRKELEEEGVEFPQQKSSSIPVEGRVAELEAQRDAEILEKGKPDVKMEFVSAQELVNSPDPVLSKQKHDDIKDRFKEIKSVIDCLWAKK